MHSMTPAFPATDGSSLGGSLHARPLQRSNHVDVWSEEEKKKTVHRPMPQGNAERKLSPVALAEKLSKGRGYCSEGEERCAGVIC